MNRLCHRRVRTNSTAIFAWALVAVPALSVALLTGCSNSPGRPTANSETVAPNDILDFDTLYAGNCSGCHGPQGKGGASIALANPVYLAIADDVTVRNAIAKGLRGTLMPAFAQRAGGMLTDKQVDVIASGIRSNWGKPGILDGANPPSYTAKSPGDAPRGAAAFKTYCASCHGAEGRGGPKGSSITDDSFLALLSDQELRTMVITGRPELGAPDWRGNVPGRPMSEQDVSDVVAWLVAQRAQNPGQPYSVSTNAQR